MAPSAGGPQAQDSNHPNPPREGLTDAQRLALREEVEKLVEKLVDREIKWLRLASGGIMVLFTVFGVTTYHEIKSQATNIAKSQVERLINQTDSETSVRRALDRLVGRSVMTASLIALRRPETPPFNKSITLRTRSLERELNLSFDDWTRLQKWVQDEDLDQQDFSGTLVVLAAQDEERARQDAGDFLAEMLNPRARSKFAWMKNQQVKRLAILQTFLRPGLESPALEIATSSESSQELRIAALDYLAAVHYKDGFERLLTLAASGDDEEVALRALLTCAWLDPLDGNIEQAAEKTLKGTATPRNVDKAIRLAAAIWYAPSPTKERTEDIIKAKIVEERLGSAKKLLSYGFDNRARTAILDGGVVAIFVKSEKGPDDQAFGVEKERFDQFVPYWELLKDAAMKGDVARISVLAPRSASQRGLSALRLDLSETAGVMVSQSPEGEGSQVELSESANVDQVLLSRSVESELRGDEILKVLWTDTQGRERQGTLVGMSGSGFRFSLPREFY